MPCAGFAPAATLFTGGLRVSRRELPFVILTEARPGCMVFYNLAWHRHYTMSRSTRQNLWASLFCVVIALIALGIGAATKAPLDTQVAPPLVGTPNDMTSVYTGTLYLPGGQVVTVRCDYTYQCWQVPK